MKRLMTITLAHVAVLLALWTAGPPDVGQTAAPGSTQDVARAEATQGIQWGEPVSGLEIGLEFADFIPGPGAVVKLIVTLKNVGAESYTVFFPEAIDPWDSRILIQVGDRVLEYRGPWPDPAEPTTKSFVKLAPAGSVSSDVNVRLEDHRLTVPFEADFTCPYRSVAQTLSVLDLEQDAIVERTVDWEGELHSGTIHVSVR